MRDWAAAHKVITSAEKAEWDDVVKPAVDGLFAASTDDLDAQWASFQVRFRERYPSFVEYMHNE